MENVKKRTINKARVTGEIKQQMGDVDGMGKPKQITPGPGSKGNLMMGLQQAPSGRAARQKKKAKRRDLVGNDNKEDIRLYLTGADGARAGQLAGTGKGGKVFWGQP